MAPGDRARAPLGVIAVGLVAAALAAAAPAYAGPVVFSSQPCGGTDCEHAVWRVNDDGSGLRRLTGSGTNGPDAVRDLSPSWSADGRQVAYYHARGRPAGLGLWVMNADGSEGRRIDDGGGYPFANPDWSPTLDLVAFGSQRPGGAGRPDAPSALPLGIRDNDVFLINADGSNLRRIVAGRYNEEPFGFSTDGSQVFIRRSAGTPGREPTGAGYFAVDLDGSRETPLTIGSMPQWARYSPDGTHVAVLLRQGSLVHMKADGSGRRVLELPLSARQPLVWSADGSALFFTKPPTGRSPAEAQTLHKLDVTKPDSRPVPLVSGRRFDGSSDWTNGEPDLIPVPDPNPPVWLLLADGRPGGPAVAATSRRARRYQPVRRRRLTFVVLDFSGVGQVEAAIAKPVRRRSKTRCRFSTGTGMTRARSCRRPVLLSVPDLATWRRRIANLRRGRYLIGLRTTDLAGNRSRLRLSRLLLR